MLIEYEIKEEARLKASSQADRDCQEGVDSDRNAMFCALSADVDKYGGVCRTLILYPIYSGHSGDRAFEFETRSQLFTRSRNQTFFH